MEVMSAGYLTTLGATALASVSLCVTARYHPGRWVDAADRALAVVLLAVSAVWVWDTGTADRWSATTSLPLALCDLATLVAAAALWWGRPLLVELTWFWGLAGSLQSLLTPDVAARFPSLEFGEYVVAHAGIVTAALFLVVGQKRVPRRRAAPRVLALTAAYTGFVGLVDGLTGADYMYLRHPPASWTILTALGPWPWYIFGAAAVAVVLVTALDAPFWPGRRHASRPPSRPVGPTGAPPTGAPPTGAAEAGRPSGVGLGDSVDRGNTRRLVGPGPGRSHRGPGS